MEDNKRKLLYSGGSKEEWQDRQKSASDGFMKAANDNPVSNTYAWIKKKMEKKKEDE